MMAELFVETLTRSGSLRTLSDDRRKSRVATTTPPFGKADDCYDAMIDDLTKVKDGYLSS
jgi:hypothetical protein